MITRVMPQNPALLTRGTTQSGTIARVLSVLAYELCVNFTTHLSLQTSSEFTAVALRIWGKLPTVFVLRKHPATSLFFLESNLSLNCQFYQICYSFRK